MRFFSFLRNFYTPVNSDKAVWLLQISAFFEKNQVVCSLAVPKTLPLGSHSSANFQRVLDCFIPHF